MVGGLRACSNAGSVDETLVEAGAALFAAPLFLTGEVEPALLEIVMVGLILGGRFVMLLRILAPGTGISGVMELTEARVGGKPLSGFELFHPENFIT